MSEQNVVEKSAIPVGDLRKMMMPKVPENAAPYDRASIEYSRKMVGDFFSEVVEPNSESGKINCMFVTEAWVVYQEGKETERMWALKDELPTVSKETMEYWRIIFELPVDQMLKLGRSAIMSGFDALNLWYRRWLLDIKYKCFFSDPDPETWIRKKDDIRDFEKNVSMYKCPVDMHKYIEKMRCIHKHIVALQ